MLALPDYVHRFSAPACSFSAPSHDRNYMYENRRGFSTFLLDIELKSGIKAGQRSTCTLQWSTSATPRSIRHRMTDARTRYRLDVSRVHLDSMPGGRRPCGKHQGCHCRRHCGRLRQLKRRKDMSSRRALQASRSLPARLRKRARSLHADADLAPR